MSSCWWQGLFNRGKLKLQSPASPRRRGRRRNESRRILFEPLEPRVLLDGNPYINLNNGVANSFIGGQYTWVQIPIRIDNLQDSAGDVGLGKATVQLSFSTSASIATAANGGATESGNTVTITTQAAQSFVAGESVSISGVSNTSYNGTFTITAVPSSTTFTCTNPSYADLPNSGGGKAAASFFQEGAVQTTANPNDGPSNQAPIVVKGPLVSRVGWSFSVSQGTGTVKIIASDSWQQDYDITTSDPTNGGTSPDGDILAYLFLYVEGDTASLPNVPVTVVDSATSLVEDVASGQQTNDTTYPTLDADQNASVQVVTDSTAPVAELSVDTQGIGTASGGTQYTVPVMLTPSTPGGVGVRLSEADLLFDPNYIAPNSISVTAGNLIPSQDWYWGGNVSVGGNYSQEGAPPSVDRAAIQLYALGVTTTNVCNIASNSTGSLWVIHFTTMPGVTGSTVLNLVPSVLSAFPELTSVQDGNPSYWNYTLSPAPTEGLSDAVDGTINFPPPVSTTTTVASSSASTTYGTPVTFTATVSAESGSVAPTAGRLEFFDTTTDQDLGPAALSNSSGATSTWTLATGTKTLNATSGDTITATYTAEMGFANSTGTTTETVAPLPIAVTAAANTKTYDGTTSASATPTITSGSLVSGDTAAFTEAYVDSSPGTAVSLEVSSYTISDGNGGGNYAVSPAGATGVINSLSDPPPSGALFITTVTGEGQLSEPQGVAVDAAGDIFIADTTSGVVREVSHSNDSISTIAGGGSNDSSNYSGPATGASLPDVPRVAVNASGTRLYIDDTFADVIREVDLTSTPPSMSTVAGNGVVGYNGDNRSATGAELNYPFGIALDASGNLYIADSDNFRVRKVDTSGNITTVAGDGVGGYTGNGGPATSAELGYVTGLAIDAAGDLFISDNGNDVIRRVDGSTHVITTYAGTGTVGYYGENVSATSAQLHWPEGIAVDAAGDLFIADWYNNRVREVDSSSGLINWAAPLSHISLL
jgi:hypothetical protein